MNTTNEFSASQDFVRNGGQILKTDVLGRVTIGREQRELILNAFEMSGMTGQAFALHHGIKIQTFASWIQKRRRTRGDYQNEAMCRKLRMRKDTAGTSLTQLQKPSPPQTPMQLFEVALQNETSTPCAPLEVLLPGGAVVKISHESQLRLLQSLLHKLSC